MLNVHVRVNDAATGQPTPVRLRFAGANGEYYPPLGRAAVFPVGRNEDVGGHVYLAGKHYSYIAGSCEVPLPTAVPLTVEISKGPGYSPIRRSVALGEGQLSLRFAIPRRADASWNDFVAVDSRCHFLTPYSARLEAEAEGIDIVNLLVTVQDCPSPDGHMYRVIPNLTAISGPTAAHGNVYVNTLNVHPTLGRLGLLNCHRPIFPLTFGHMDETDDWSLGDWCDQCHRKKGLVVWCDPYRQSAGLAGGEALLNAILGKVDAIEIDGHERTSSFLVNWYRLLNAGVWLPIVGGSGKDSNRIALGGVRTLTPADESRSYSDWVECVRAGKSMATNGPLIRWSIDGQRFPTRIVADSSRPVRIHAEIASCDPIERFEIVANGEVIDSRRPVQGDGSTAVLETEHRLPAGGWIAVRCWGTSKPDLYPHLPIFAHSSPCIVEVNGMPTWRQASAVAGLEREIRTVRHWVETDGRFTNSRRKDQLLSRCDEAFGKLSGQP